MAEEKQLPLLLIDFTEDPMNNIEMSDASMAKALGGPAAGWSAQKIRMVKSQHGLMSTIPTRCKGQDACPYANDCPFDEAEVKKSYKGKGCPVEVVQAFKVFAGFVIDLDIKPEDFSDLQLVVDLVRLVLLMRRCDLYAKDKPVWEKQLGGINQKTGDVHWNKVPVLSFDMQAKIRKDIKDIYDQLIASRAAKVKRDASMKDVKGATDLFSQLKQAAAAYQEEQKRENRRRVRLEPEPVPAIEAPQDAEFEMTEESVEEQ